VRSWNLVDGLLDKADELLILRDARKVRLRVVEREDFWWQESVEVGGSKSPHHPRPSLLYS
jgi:hypothetical protein